VKLDSLRFEIICFVLNVPVRDHRFVSEYKTKRNTADVLWQDIQQAAMKNKQKLR
jgi:hypothetical protein